MATVELSPGDAFVLLSLRDEVRSTLALCNPAQQALFGRMYPEGIDAMSESKLRCAVGQIQRTIASNEKASKR